jgi:hypothetical protein
LKKSSSAINEMPGSSRLVFQEIPPEGRAMQATKLSIRIWNNSEGKGTLGCLVSIILLGAAIIIGMRVGPPYFSYKSLEGDVSTEVSRAGAHFFSDDVLVQNILDVAKKNEIVLSKDSIKVERFAGQLQVSIHYRVPVDLIFFQHTMNFDIKASSYIGTL